MTSIQENPQEGLFIGVERGNIGHAVAAVRDFGADVNARSDTRENRCALHIAVVNGDDLMVGQLLDLGADIDMRDESNFTFTPLLLAAFHGHAKVLKLLLERGAKTELATAYNQKLCELAACTMRNAGPVWKVLMEHESRIPPSDHPTHPEGGQEILRTAMIAISSRDGGEGDPSALAAAIRHGADWTKYTTSLGETLLPALILWATGNPESKRSAYIAQVIKHVFDAGVSPFMESDIGLYAYNVARFSPEIFPVFQDKCTPLAQRVANFKPGGEPLLDETGKPTEFTKYACCEGKLGGMLAPQIWAKPVDLIAMKRALDAALPEPYRAAFAAHLDPTSLIRHSATGSLFNRFTGGSGPTGGR